MLKANLLKIRQEDELRTYYRTLLSTWGPQHWWPAETQFEVILGAYLTQNTAWTNVERALANLRNEGKLTLDVVRQMPLRKLERLIRPSGYFRQKAKRIKTLIAFLDSNYDGSLDLLFSQPTEKLREELLTLNGVGPETADSILLYAGNHPVFVVDAYTRRILERHEIISAKSDYEVIRELLERALEPQARSQEQHPSPLKTQPSTMRGASHPPSTMSRAYRPALVQVYNEMHGLIVAVGKNHCGKSNPKCASCPLRPFLP